MGIAIRILDIVAESLPQGPPLCVRAVRVRIGKLSAVVPDSLRWCFAAASSDGPFAGAELLIHEVAVRLACGACGDVTLLAAPPFACARCGSGEVSLLNGRELEVESIEVEEVTEAPAPRPEE
jgi:hydrogenase nickel incorporation protein HypA/HybF